MIFYVVIEHCSYVCGMHTARDSTRSSINTLGVQRLVYIENYADVTTS